ncbi:MAG: hypothetical protein KatS3mg059_1080 [Thermomicrobiales bacterium]|nr:MAG: hypothetical protein KatS3mg059_1080 [Thermomicrobiales bacterium]
MQTPIRYYILQDEDHPVVRTVPVAKPVAEPMTSASASATETPMPVAQDAVPARSGARIKRLMRAARRHQDKP